MKAIKKVIKSALPSGAERTLRKQLDRTRSYKLYKTDRRRFMRNYSKAIEAGDSRRLCARMIFHTHSLEKGLSHTELRPNFGQSALTNLSDAMKLYIKSGFSLKDKAWTSALATLGEYIDVHQKISVEPVVLKSVFDENILNMVRKNKQKNGGTSVIKGKEKQRNDKKDFADLFANRYSVREFSDDLVDIAKIYESLEISTKSPSVCNRQSVRTQIIDDPKMIDKVLRIQGGFTGYRSPPAVLAITSDIRNFVAVSERNQIYIDGGIYSMALLLALEYVGLAACPLNAMFSTKKDREMRQVLDTPDNEVFIMFIAVGNFKKSVKVAKSFRYSAKDVSKLN